MNNKQTELEPAQANGATVASRSKVERETVSVYRLPDFDADGRTDHLAQREFLITLPAGADYERTIKKIYGAGHYRVELRKNGHFKSVSEFHLEDRQQRDPVAPDEAINLQLVDDYESEDERVERIVSAALAAQRADFQTLQASQQAIQQPQTQPTATSALRDALDVLKEMQSINTLLNPAPPQPLQQDEETILTRAIVSNTGLLEKVISRVVGVVGRADAEPEHWALSLGRDFAAGVMPYVAPHVAPLIVGRLKSVLASKLPDGEQASEVSETEEAETSALDEVLFNMLQDLEANEPVDESAKQVSRLMEDDPQAAVAVSGLLSMPTVNLLATIRDNVPDGDQYIQLPHAAQWLEKLKAAVAARRQVTSKMASG
jgi:hypothetical protein